MKIKQSDVQVGDLLLMAKNSKLTIIKILSITKKGSLKYSYHKNNWGDETRDYYDQLELNPEEHNNILYLQKGLHEKYQNYFWLLERDGKRFD